MRVLIRFLSLSMLILAVGYLLLPTPPFPLKPPDSVQSLEDADTETPLRRAYFTNFTREQVIDHYRRQLAESKFLGIPIPAYRLNYPPEDAFMLIRNQTRSTFLEEIVNPLRESLYVNGFEPKVAKDAISYKGVRYERKITIKYAPSSALVRIPIVLLAISVFLILVRDLWVSARKILRN